MYINVEEFPYVGAAVKNAPELSVKFPEMEGEVVIVVFPFRVRLPIVILFAPEIANTPEASTVPAPIF